MCVPGIVKGEGWFIIRPAICEAVASICLTSCFCSLMSIGAVSFNRYIHICHNEHYRKIYTPRNSVLICVGLWIVCFTAEMSCFIGWGDHSYDRKTLSCVWDRTADFSYTVFFSGAGVAFPIVLISICYIKIYAFFRASKKRVAAMEMNSPSGGSKPDADGVRQIKKQSARNESMKLARTLFIIFAVFAACWTPYAIIVVADIHDEYAMEVHIFSILLAHTNSSLNSVLYGLTNVHFRQGYLKVVWLCCGWCCCGKNAEDFDQGDFQTVRSPSNPEATQNEVNITTLSHPPLAPSRLSKLKARDPSI